MLPGKLHPFLVIVREIGTNKFQVTLLLREVDPHVEEIFQVFDPLNDLNDVILSGLLVQEVCLINALQFCKQGGHLRVLLRESALMQRIQEAVEVLVEIFNLEELAHAHDLVED